MVPSSSSGSAKRTRALSNGGSTTGSCLVDGCVSDLIKCREYHRRHKVCEVHSKTPIVMVGGREQRYCQQCSRFHLLMEFDEVKRSCRKRLEEHNRRRRKPQMRSPSCGTYMASHPGTRFTSCPQIFSTTTARSNCPSIKAEEILLDTHFSPRHLINRCHNYDHFPVSSRGIFKDGKKFPFLQEDVQAAPDSACQPLLRTISAAGSLRSSSKLFDSDCALSLLSSPEAHSLPVIISQDATIGDRFSIGQPLIPATQYGSLGRYYGSQAYNTVSATGFSYSGMGHEHAGAVLISDHNADFQCNGLFQAGGELSSDGNSQTLSFSWQ